MHYLLMFCHGTQIMDNSRIFHCLLFHEHGKLNLWRRLYEYHYAWPLPEANVTTMGDLTVPSVSSLPLSVMVRSRAFIGVELVHLT